MMNRIISIAASVVVGVAVGSGVGAVGWLLVWLFVAPAKAEGADYRDGRWYRQEYRRVHRQQHRHYYREPAPIRYYAAPRYDDERDDRGRCHEVRKAVGDQHLTVDGAKKAANDAWAGTVRFHLGESAMDLSNAREITYVCSRSSIKEGGTSVTTLGQQLNRCEISAQPCRPPKLPLEREER